MKKEYLVVGALILLLFGGFSLAGAFSFFSQKDAYYDHEVTATQSVTYGQPIDISIKLQEKPGGSLSLCDINGQGNRISPDTLHYCQSYTYFNARSIRVKIDGEETLNFYYYPANSNGLATPLQDVGAVCCLDTCGSPCSVCADQNNAGTQYHRAYIYASGIIPPQQTISGQNLFSLSIPQTLPDGVHNVELFFFEETIKGANDNTCTPVSQIRKGGNQYGDQNEEYNYYYAFTINVSGQPNYVPPTNQTVGNETLPPANYTAPPPVNYTPPSNTPPTYTPPSGNPPASQSSVIGILGLAIAAIVFWKVVLRR
jgi:hypothetical protein